jgi:hypothetical protein
MGKSSKMVPPERQDLAWAGFFVSHTLADAEYCRKLILPIIETVVHRRFNQYVFMDYEHFGRGHGEKANPASASYAKEIERLLNHSRAMLLVASVAATRSKWLKREVDWWVQNRPLEELTVVIREPCDPSELNPAVAKCLQMMMYDTENLVNAARLRARIESFISQ